MYYANGRYYEAERGGYIDAIEADIIEGNAYNVLGLDRNGIMLLTLLMLAPYSATIATALELYSDPTYDPKEGVEEEDTTKKWWKKHWWEVVTAAVSIVVGVVMLVTGNVAGVLSIISGVCTLVGAIFSEQLAGAMGTATLGVQTIMIGVQSLSCSSGYGIIAIAVGAVCVAFATAEAQEALGYGNWLKDTVGMSDEVYAGVMLAANMAAIAINIVGVKQCFKEGTLVACLNENGEEVRKPIESIVGDPTLVVPEAEYTVKYITAHKMIENKDNLVPSFSREAKLEVKNGEIIGWENGQFLYRGANAVDVNIQITNNCKEIAFSLKAASDGVMWQATGYFLYVNEGTASLYRVADPSTWNAELLASVGVNNIFDGKVHNFKFYAVKDSLGHLQLGYSIDGANTTKAVDSGEILNEESDNFKIVSVNSTVLYKVLPDEAEHTYGEAEVTAPTCTEKGFETLTCTGCGHVIVREGAAALNHDYVETVTAATCLTGGYSTFTCSRCNDTYTDEETSSLGHAFEDKREEPTCTAAGKTYKECTRCNFIKDEEEIFALGHDYETITTPATCTENGEQHEKCRRCNEETAQTVIPATGHNWVEKDRVEATAEADGHVDYKCSKCEETKSETLTYEEPASSGESSGDAEEGCIASVGGGVNGIVILALLAAGIANKKRKD